MSTGSSGLGLPIVAALVAAHHGTVTLGPGPAGTGTHVVVRLPAALLIHEQPTES
jgi:signal transduction histidine kinase